MHDRSKPRRWRVIALLIGALALCVAPASAAPQKPFAPSGASKARQAAFAAAASEFGVPERVLLAVSYALSRWETHGGAPSFAGGYGPMHLTHLDSAPSFDAKGDRALHPARDTRAVASLHTLDAAAQLLGLRPEILRNEPAQNIRGGAALLAQYARETNGGLPASEADWYSAVMRYSQASDIKTAASFADLVYATIQQGAARTTDDGEMMMLQAAAIAPNRPAQVAAISATAATQVECPSGVTCDFIPAAYKQNDPNDPTNYGNYDLANRPADGLAVRYIVIHDVEGSYNSALTVFQEPTYGASAHYVVRSSDGHIAQMVETKNVAWHAGNWYINGHAIGIEHEGFAISGATWYTESMYSASANLVKYLATKYGIPLDRAHIIGHDDIPGPTTDFQSGMHWDPGLFWDWSHYMDLIQAPLGGGSNTNILTIKPNFSKNIQTVKDCEGRNATLKKASNFVYLRTKPSANAPYITDPYLTLNAQCANNWGNKAVAGQTFYRAGHQGDWDAIYFGGQKAWFYNPGGANTVPGKGTLITPKAGLSSIQVYGRAYPEGSAYPSGITQQSVVALTKYTLPAGQIYVAFGPFNSDYYYAPNYTPTLEGSANKDIQGQTQYYQIFFNHRFAFVQASDVMVVP
jgi:N-acetyl-anhydromuramyl-L-alanine amidase AmpD